MTWRWVAVAFFLTYDNAFIFPSSLVQMMGGVILFLSEESSHDWCGEPGRECIECVSGIKGKDDVMKCADRMMSKTLAVKLDRLGHWIIEEWSDSKCICLFV